MSIVKEQPRLKLLGKWRIGLALAAAITIGAVALNKLQQVPHETITPAPITNSTPAPTVTALGRLEPQGEVIHLSAPSSIQGTRVDQLLVKEGQQVRTGENAEVILEQLRKSLPQDVKVLSKQEFIDFEKDYWASSTAIGFIFTLGTIMGFVVGTVIVYQVLYSEVADHLPEYTTLKAMGYTQTYLLLVVFQQALILATLGYVPGFAFAIFQYNLAREVTLLPIIMTNSRALMVIVLTILICFISGTIAVRKLEDADPVDIF